MTVTTEQNYGARVQRRDVTVPAKDGRALAATWWEPQRCPARGVVVIAPAMATPMRYYERFSEWLAARGFRAMSFQHRGTDSRRAMREERGDLLQWFEDAAEILEYAVNEAQGLPVTWVGHSLGGQMLPFVGHASLHRAVTVASGTGYWRLNVPGVRWAAPLVWHLLVPTATRVAGYYPGRTLGVLGDIPSGVARQWARWCLSSRYLGRDVADADSRFAAVRTPMTVLSFTDDELMSDRSIADLHDRFVNAPQLRMRFTPEQLDVSRMGHHGFFRGRHRYLWDELILPFLS